MVELNFFNCTVPHILWLFSIFLYKLQRVDFNTSLSRTWKHKPSHWPLSLRKYLWGETTWSDHDSMCFDKLWPQPDCFICYDSRSPDAQCIDIPVKKGYLQERAYKPASWCWIYRNYYRKAKSINTGQKCPWCIVSHKQFNWSKVCSSCVNYSYKAECFRLLLLLCKLFPGYHGKRLAICLSDS